MVLCVRQNESAYRINDVQYGGQHPVARCGKVLFLASIATSLCYAIIVPYDWITYLPMLRLDGVIVPPPSTPARNLPPTANPKGTHRYRSDFTARHDLRSPGSYNSTHHPMPRNSVMPSRCGCSDQWGICRFAYVTRQRYHPCYSLGSMSPCSL